MNTKHIAHRGSWRERLRANRAARTWIFRFAAVLLGLLPLVAIETTLRSLNVPDAASRVEALAEATASRRLFVLDPQNNRYQIAPEHFNLFCPTGFPARKSPETKRIFVLGGSTVQGRPYAIPTAFPAWLELLLNASDRRSFDWEVVNCGGVSYASYRIAAMLPEMMQYQPDLIVIYCGHNEYLERVSVGDLQSLSKPQAMLLGLAERSHLFQLARQSILGTPKPIDSQTRQLVGQSVQALLDNQGGLQHYHRDVPSRSQTEVDFVSNLKAMIDYCDQRQVPLVLCCPARNVVDCPPFKSEEAADLKASQRTTLDRFVQRSIDPDQSLSDRIAALQGSQQLDPQNPSVAYRLGRLLLEVGDAESAATQLNLAADLDCCPLRIRSSMQKAIRQLSEKHRVWLVDIDREMRATSPFNLVGENLMVDHVHPTIAGHQMIASELAKRLAAEGLVELRPDWREAISEIYAQHLATLDEAYFVRGKQRLAGLRLWAAGRAGSLP